MRAALLAAASLTGVLLAGRSVAEEAAPTAEALSVEDAVALALRNNRRVAIAALEVDRAEQKLAASRTRRLPNLELNAMAGSTLNTIGVTFPAGAFGTFPGIGPVPSTETTVEAPRAVSGNVSATLSQPLTQLYKIGLGTRLNELSRDVQQEKLREQRTSIAAEVRRTYYGLLQARSALTAAEERVRVYRELSRVVGQQVKVEVVLRSDGLDVESRLVSEEQHLLEAQGDLSEGKQRLNLLLGRDLDQEFSLVSVSEASLEEVDLPTAMAHAVEHRPDLAQARLAVEQADTDRRMKKAESIPELSLAISYWTFVNVNLLPKNIAQAGLQLKWEPFDWGRRGKERAEKTLQLEQAKNQAREAESRARLDVTHNFRKLHEARLQLKAARLGVESAQEKLRVTTSRHSVEAALLKDVLEAQASSSAASMQYDRALAVFWTAKADFRSALGEEQ